MRIGRRVARLESIARRRPDRDALNYSPGPLTIEELWTGVQDLQQQAERGDTEALRRMARVNEILERCRQRRDAATGISNE